MSNTNVKLSKGIFLNHYIFTKIVKENDTNL